MENSALYQLGQLVYDYCGLNYQNNLASMEKKLYKRLDELQVNSTWHYIRYLEENPSEWDSLVEVLTINETYFYREDKQLLVYQHTVLPQLLATTTNRPLKVWSAACSTGEEPYSLAIMTMDAGVNAERNVQILGTDINKKVLNIAENGTYNKRSLSFRRIPEAWLQTYFVETPTSFEIIDRVKNMVSFDYLNLLEMQDSEKNETYDVIFCRNVLIYFDEETIKKVVTSFYHQLKKGGYLFLGHAETITKLDLGFETMNTNGTFYYRKG